MNFEQYHHKDPRRKVTSDRMKNLLYELHKVGVTYKDISELTKLNISIATCREHYVKIHRFNLLNKAQEEYNKKLINNQ